MLKQILTYFDTNFNSYYVILTFDKYFTTRSLEHCFPSAKNSCVIYLFVNAVCSVKKKRKKERYFISFTLTALSTCFVVVIFSWSTLTYFLVTIDLKRASFL